MALEGWIWGDHQIMWHESEPEQDHDPPPASVAELDMEFGESSDPALRRIAHIDTPELHLDDVARQNAWVEGLRSLSAEAVDHGPIEVLDGEIVPEGALREAVPDGARVYEVTGNEGASLELQFRRAVLVVWRRNEATLRMLARCGGRLALAVELAERSKVRGTEHRGGVQKVLELWPEALQTDGGGAEPRAHRLLLDAMVRKAGARREERLRTLYVEKVARVDLDAEAVPTLVRWIRARVQAGEPVDAWVRALGPGCSGFSPEDVLSGAPALLRALCEAPETETIAIGLAARPHEPPPTREAVLAHADWLDERVAVQEWTRRRVARMTVDDAQPAGAGEAQSSSSPPPAR